MSTFVFGADDGVSQGDDRQLHEALLAAVRLGWAGIERVTKLIQDGARVDLAETFANTDESPLMAAAKDNDNLVCLRALIDAGADVNLVTQGVDGEVPGYTALMWAAAYGNWFGVKALIDAGAMVDSASPDGSTALILAITFQRRGGSPERCVAELIAGGADLNLPDSESGETPLYIAVKMMRGVIVHQLIMAGANVRPTGVSRALIVRATMDCVRIYRRHNRLDDGIVSMLIEADADLGAVYTFNSRLPTALSVAASIWDTQPKLTTMLVSGGADPMTPSNTSSGPYFTPEKPYFEPVIALCRARLAALQPERIAAACRKLEHDVVALRVTGREPDAVVAAALKAAVAAAAGPDAPWEVVKMLEARAEIQHGHLLLGGVGERLGETGNASQPMLAARAHWAAEGGGAGELQQPPWGRAELHLVLASARHSAIQDVPRKVADAERVLQAVMHRIEVARTRQKKIVARLPEFGSGSEAGGSR